MADGRWAPRKDRCWKSSGRGSSAGLSQENPRIRASSQDEPGGPRLYPSKAAQASTSAKSGQADIKTMMEKRNNSAQKL
jgi:hypothetical protein